jgi:hypothetical protein
MASHLQSNAALAAEQARDRISYLRTLPPGWNTYGSPAIAGQAIDRALQILEALRISGIRMPQIVPTSDGGIQFEWHLPTRRLEIEFDDEGNMGFFSVDAHGEAEGALAGYQDMIRLQLLDGLR